MDAPTPGAFREEPKGPAGQPVHPTAMRRADLRNGTPVRGRCSRELLNLAGASDLADEIVGKDLQGSERERCCRVVTMRRAAALLVGSPALPRPPTHAITLRVVSGVRDPAVDQRREAGEQREVG